MFSSPCKCSGITSWGLGSALRAESAFRKIHIFAFFQVEICEHESLLKSEDGSAAETCSVG